MRWLPVGVAALAAAWLAAVGVVDGTYAAGGSDSSCYALMAEAFASGEIQPSSPLAAQVPWPDATRTLTPGGFVPSATTPGAFAPVCAPGFSMILAVPLMIAGQSAMFAMTPISGALLVMLGYLSAARLATPLAGAMTAVLIATSPVVLYQVVQPMNDITTTAVWMAVFVALLYRKWFVAGLCCGLALLVRPNLLPLAGIVALFLLVPSPESRVPSRLWKFAAGALPGGLVVLTLNAALYGSPFKSGYGTLEYLFDVSFVPQNAIRYSRWLFETQSVFVLLALAAPFVLPRERSRAAWLAIALALTTAGIYLLYHPFDDWSYLRFLLPAIAFLIVLASSATAVLASRLGRVWSVAVVVLTTAAVAAFGIRAADTRLAFALQALEQRYRSAGVVVRDRLPPDAVIFSVWDSGAVRFHGRKEAVNWEALDPEWLDRAVTWSNEHGRKPYFLLESWEEPAFREHFRGRSELGALDWPPKFEVDRVVRIYDPADRARYIANDRVVTEFVWPFLKVESRK